jgi:hypothetical protein
MATSLDLARTYTSYSGVDIRVIINGAQVGSMQALSYAIQREKAPIYVMGSVDPISYSRGKRGIAGTMISLMMDTHILMSPSFTGEYYLGDSDEIFATATNSGGARATDTTAYENLNNEVDSGVRLAQIGSTNFGASGAVGFMGVEQQILSGAAGAPGANASGPYQRFTKSESYDLSKMGNNYRVAPVFYVDQILPFDIAIVAANEYGQTAQMRLYGCEILNEGSGFSIDDIVIENQMTYVCRTILPWRSIDIKVKGPESDVLVDAREKLYGRLASEGNRGDVASSNAAFSYTGGKKASVDPTNY